MPFNTVGIGPIPAEPPVHWSPIFQATGLTFTGTNSTYPTAGSVYSKSGYNVSFWIEINLSTVTNFGTEASFNKALAQLLNNSSAEAMKTVDLSLDKESARGFYLKAIAAARMDKSEAVMSNLKNAISKDASFKTKAGKDSRRHNKPDTRARHSRTA